MHCHFKKLLGGSRTKTIVYADQADTKIEGMPYNAVKQRNASLEKIAKMVTREPQKIGTDA